MDNVGKSYEFSKRVIGKNLPRINFDGKYDGKGKEYLVKLYKKGYQVIPTIDNLNDINSLNSNKFMLKLKSSYDGIGQIIVDEGEIKNKFNDSYIIQPFIQFKSVKLEDDTLLLTEIEDISPYLDCVDEKIRNKFIRDYKNMVNDYIKNRFSD